MGIRTVLDKLVAMGEEDTSPAPRRALALPSLREYVPHGGHMRRIARGLVVLIRMAWKAIRTAVRRATAKPQPKGKTVGKPPAKGEQGRAAADHKTAAIDAVERVGAAVLTILVALAASAGIAQMVWSQIEPYARTVAGVTVVGLLAAAWAVGPKAAAQDDPAGDPQRHDAGGEAPATAPLPQPAAPLDVAAIAHVVRQLAAPHGWLGAHLDDVLAHLPGRSRTELLAVLAAAGIPVENQLKIRLPGGRQRNRQGIRLSHLPAAPDQPPVPAAPEAAPEDPSEAVPDRTPHLPSLAVYGTE